MGCEEMLIRSERLNFTDFIEDTIFGEERYRIVSATGWKKVELDAPITEEYRSVSMAIENDSELRRQIAASGKYADTDDDELFDLEEIYYELNGITVIKFDESGKAILPKYDDCRRQVYSILKLQQ